MQQRLSREGTEGSTNRLDRECEVLDRQTDQAAYELYGLTEEEMKVVGGND